MAPTCKLWGKRFLSLLVAGSMALGGVAPATALAAGTQVQVDNHAAAGQLVLSGIAIDGVSAPQAGAELDATATVTASEGVSWEIPVLWIDDGLNLATQAEEGRTYLPALAFFVPGEYSVEGGSFTVALSDPLAKLFGGSEVVSVYDASSGITHILPASLRDFFARARQAVVAQEAHDELATQDRAAAATPDATAAQPAGAPGAAAAPSATPADEGATGDAAQPGEGAEPEEHHVVGVPEARSIVDVYCAQTAKDAFTDEDLEYLLNLVINTLQPQAVNLLLDSFPAFRAGAEQGSIGTQIGLYVYYKKGDEDGHDEHANTPADSLAFVMGGSQLADDGEYRYHYMIGIDLEDLAKKDDEDEPVRDPATGKYVLVRQGKSMHNLEFTLVHELFHALMDDYNRTGMAGGTNMADVVTNSKGELLTQEAADLYERIHYPYWFVEGTASATENIYDFRHDDFALLRSNLVNGKLQYKDTYEWDDLLGNYVQSVTTEDDKRYFDLEYAKGYDASDNSVETTSSRYVSGYLASLYLSELAAQKSTGESAITKDENSIVISSEKLRMGLDNILERMHNGETLDQVINDISPVDENGNKLYTSADDFTKKYIKGVPTQGDGTDYYHGDEASMEFTLDLLNHLEDLGQGLKNSEHANGSILFDFDDDYNTPLDDDKESSSDYLQIVQDNTLVLSTVPDSEALKGGGKSVSGTPTQSPESPADEGAGADEDAQSAQTDGSTEGGTTEGGEHEPTQGDGQAADAALADQAVSAPTDPAA